MALLDGKQLRDGSISLDKLQGNSGLVTFTSSATMSFGAGTSLTTEDVNIVLGVDVVNKNYVDSVAAGLNPKASSKVIYDGDITSISGYTYSNGDSGVGATLTFTASGLTSIDSVSLSSGDRVIINSSTDQFVNGIYEYGTTASFFTRTSDFDGSPAQEVDGGEFSFVTEGTLNADTGWVVSSPNSTATIGTTPIIWTQFSAAGVITAGDGLVQVGTAFNVGAGTGITVSSSQVSIATTGVSATSYGAAGTVGTFTVNAQGQLTAASDLTIDISSSQVNDFTTASETAIFTTGNFVDGTTVDFTVTAGDSVTAEVTTGSLTASHLNNNSQGATAGYILSVNADGTFAWIDNQVGDITGITAGVGLTGGGSSGFVTLDVQAANGLNVDVTSDSVELGGTLTKNTTIDGADFDFTLGNVGIILMTASTFDVEADGFVSIDAGTGSAQFLADDTITISASNSVDIVSLGGVYVQGDSFSVNGVEIDPTSPTTGYVLTYDGTSFVPQAAAGDITDVTAGVGLSGGGTQGAVTLDVDFPTVVDTIGGAGLTSSGSVLNIGSGTGIIVNADDIEIDFVSIVGSGLTQSGGVISNTITPTALAGDGLSVNGSALDVNVNSDSLEIVTDTIRLKDTVTGDRTFADSITIQGNLTVSGTATYVNTENLYVVDNTITLNATYSGPASGVPYSGIEVNLGDGTYSTFLYEESTGYFVGGVSGSESAFIQEAGIGLTKSGNTLSADLTTIADSTAGSGLTASGGVINVGAGTGITVNADDVAVDFVSITGDGLTQSGGVLNVDYTTVAGNLDGAGLIVNGSELEVNTGLGMTISSDAIITDLLVNGGLTYSGNQLTVGVDNTTIQIVNGQLVATTQGDITGVTAGNGLSGGGSTGFVTLDVNTGSGITISTDAVAIDLASNSGLNTTSGLSIDSSAAGDGLSLTLGVFDVGAGAGITVSSTDVAIDLASNSGLNTTSGLSIDSSVAGTGLTFSSGVLSVVAGSAQPVYTQMNLTPAQQSLPLADEFNSTLTISNTPNDYSRVQVFVNGQLQNLGDGVKTTDCYFSATGSIAKNISGIVAGDTLYWNGLVAQFRLTTTDTISISYEV